MNVYALDTLSLNYIHRPVDDDARIELADFFLTAYNEIYRRIMSDPYKIAVTESTALQNRLFSISSLEKSFLGIKTITDKNGVKIAWEKSDGDLINVHTSEKTVKVTYYCMPELLENKTPASLPDNSSPQNTPIIPEEYHNIFSLWAAYRYLHSRRKFEDANYYYEMAMELFYALKDRFGEKTKLKINYNC